MEAPDLIKSVGPCIALQSRGEHRVQTDPNRLLPACAEFLALPAIQ